MSFFFDIFNPSFFIFLGLLMLFLACLILYFESKWREQNHKISSMVSLVSSLAEEVNHTKLVLSTISMQQQHQRDSIRHSVYTNNDSNTKDELIQCESHHIRTMECVNKIIPDQTKVECDKSYRIKNPFPIITKMGIEQRKSHLSSAPRM